GGRARAPSTIVSCQEGDTSTSRQACKHADHQRAIVLEVPVQRAYGLQCVEAGEREYRYALGCLGTPQMQGLRHEQRRVEHHPQSKDESDRLFHLDALDKLLD